MIRSRVNTDEPFRLIIGNDATLRPVPKAYSSWSDEALLAITPASGEVLDNFVFTATIAPLEVIGGGAGAEKGLLFTDAHDMSFWYRMSIDGVLELLKAIASKSAVVSEKGIASEFTFEDRDGILITKVVKERG